MRELAEEMALILDEMILREKVIRVIIDNHNSDMRVLVSRFNRLVEQTEIISTATVDQLSALPNPIYFSDYEVQLPERSAEDQMPTINLLRELEPTR